MLCSGQEFLVHASHDLFILVKAHPATVLLSKRANFRFEGLQLKYFFHEIPMSYIY